MEILYTGLKKETLALLITQLPEANFIPLPEKTPADSNPTLPSPLLSSAELLIFGETVSNPIRLAQEAYRQDRYLSILLINDAQQHATLKQAWLLAPFSGPTVQMVSSEGKQGLAKVVADQLLRTQQRRSYGKLKAFMPVLNAPTAHQFERLKQQYVDRVLEEAPIGIILLNQQGLIQSFNQHAAQLLGKTERDVLGTPFVALWTENYHIILQDLLNQHQPVTRKTTLEYTFLQQVRYLELTVAPLNTGQTPTYQIALLSEVTSQVLSRKAIEESARQVALLLESLPQIAWTTDAAGKITYLNSQWYAYTGNTPPTEKDYTTLDFDLQAYIHPEDVAPLLADWQACFRKRERFEREFRLRRGSDGKYGWMLARTVPLQDKAGNLTLWVGTSTDIEDLKRAEQQLQSLNEQLATSNEELSAANEEIRAANEEVLASNEELSQANQQLHHTNRSLRQVNEDLDTFIYTASHDLKAPILNIEGLLKALHREQTKVHPSQQKVAQMYELLHDSVNRFKETIRDLTEVARIGKEIEEDVARVELVGVLEEVLLDLAAPIEEATAQVQVSLECPLVRFSRKNLKSICYNLISNAVKYRSPERIPSIKLHCWQEEGYIVLSVQDNGLGMDMRQEEKIFGLFKRLHSHVEGTGIGLYIVKKILENAGGKIAVESQVGVGSTFTVYFKE